MITEDLGLRGAPVAPKSFDRRGMLRKKFEHPVQAEDVVFRRYDSEACITDKFQVVLQPGDDRLEVVTADFEFLDATEIVEITQRVWNFGVTRHSAEVAEKVVAGNHSSAN